MTDTFYNTISASKPDLEFYRRQVERQEDTVVAFFQAHPGRFYTPFEIQQAVLPQAPITSVRRALTNLTNDGWLEKVDQMVRERFGKPNHCWTLKRRPIQEQMRLF